MVLGIDHLRRLVKQKQQKQLVEDLSERELLRPEGTGFDLRAGTLFRLQGVGHLGVDDRQTPDVETVAQYSPDRREIVAFHPGDYYLVKTIETVNLPPHLVGTVSSRTTMFRCGIVLAAAVVAPGYEGQLTFGLLHAGQCPFTLEMGARVAHILFEEVKGKTRAYQGQWQGGRVSTEGTEKQR
jgi:deoxycytidine triphosphate deaminase